MKRRVADCGCFPAPDGTLWHVELRANWTARSKRALTALALKAVRNRRRKTDLASGIFTLVVTPLED